MIWHPAIFLVCHWLWTLEVLGHHSCIAWFPKKSTMILVGNLSSWEKIGVSPFSFLKMVGLQRLPGVPSKLRMSMRIWAMTAAVFPKNIHLIISSTDLHQLRTNIRTFRREKIRELRTGKIPRPGICGDRCGWKLMVWADRSPTSEQGKHFLIEQWKRP